MEKERKYEYWFASLPGLSDRTKWRLKSYGKGEENIFAWSGEKILKIPFLNEKEKNTIIQGRAGWDLEGEYERLQRKHIRLVVRGEGDYPKPLENISDPPYALYVKGNLPGFGRKNVAIVGARRCTTYGEKYAAEYGRRLSAEGVSVISGMALGVDGAAHRGAILGGGAPTYAVLGNGVDICYPRQHEGLYRDILEHGGGILSEVAPGTPPLAYHFPRRNRIISGLADMLLVMEAGEKSGSFITADCALDQGKDVYALPGPVDSALSYGCHLLISQGAGILFSVEEVLCRLGDFRRNLRVQANAAGDCQGKLSGEITEEMAGKIQENEKKLETTENMVYDSLCFYPKSANQLLAETKLELRTLLTALATLEIEGLAKEVSKQCYVKCGRTSTW